MQKGLLTALFVSLTLLSTTPTHAQGESETVITITIMAKAAYLCDSAQQARNLAAAKLASAVGKTRQPTTFNGCVTTPLDSPIVDQVEKQEIHLLWEAGQIVERPANIIRAYQSTPKILVILFEEVEEA